MRFFLILVLFGAALARADLACEIDLTAQRAWLLQDGQRVYETPISSGRARYATRTGEFTITEKDRDHRSSLYGRIVGADGRTIVADADADMPRPAGAKFVQAPMKYFMRFDGAVGMHAGYLPGYAASHGCVRLPASKAALFFDILEVGTPVRVFGKAPHRAEPKRPEIQRTVATPIPATPAPRKSRFPWFRRTGD